jgi:biopolymer transport protein ExbD
MAEIQEKDSGEQKKGRQKKFNVHVDFTPMVDMNMLLITFFMLCTTMSKPQTMEISMPRNDIVSEQDKNKVKESKAITILLGKDSKVYYYFGKPDYDHPESVIETDFSADGIRKVLLGRNEDVVKKINELKIKKENLEISDEQYQIESAEVRSDKNSPVVMIKATEFSQYKDLIDALDEMQICNIGRYAISDITPGDLRVLQDLTHAGYTSDLKEVFIEKEQSQ